MHLRHPIIYLHEQRQKTAENSPVQLQFCPAIVIEIKWCTQCACRSRVSTNLRQGPPIRCGAYKCAGDATRRSRPHTYAQNERKHASSPCAHNRRMRPPPARNNAWSGHYEEGGEYEHRLCPCPAGAVARKTDSARMSGSITRHRPADSSDRGGVAEYDSD